MTSGGRQRRQIFVQAVVSGPRSGKSLVVAAWSRSAEAKWECTEEICDASSNTPHTMAAVSASL